MPTQTFDASGQESVAAQWYSGATPSSIAWAALNDSSFSHCAPGAKKTGYSGTLKNYSITSTIPAGATITQVRLNAKYYVSTKSSIIEFHTAAIVSESELTEHVDTSEPLTESDTWIDITSDRSWVRDDFTDAAFKVRIEAYQGNSSTAVTLYINCLLVEITWLESVSNRIISKYNVRGWISTAKKSIYNIRKYVVDNEYNYRTKIPITGVSSEQTNYQMKLRIYKTTGNNIPGTIYLNNHALNWPYDIKFTDASENKLDYWRESYDTDVMTVWVECGTIPATVSTNFYIYYGKSGASDESNGANTFYVFDDFDSFDTGIWQLTEGYESISSSILTLTSETGGSEHGGITLKTNVDYSTQGYEVISRMRCTSHPSTHIKFGFHAATTQGMVGGSPLTAYGYRLNEGDTVTHGGNVQKYTGSWTNIDQDSATVNDSTWYKGRTRLLSGSKYWKLDSDDYSSEVVISGGNDSTYTNFYLSLVNYGLGSNTLTDYDWVFIKKYISGEPSWGTPSSETDTGAGFPKLKTMYHILAGTVTSVRNLLYNIRTTITGKHTSLYHISIGMVISVLRVFYSLRRFVRDNLYFYSGAIDQAEFFDCTAQNGSIFYTVVQGEGRDPYANKYDGKTWSEAVKVGDTGMPSDGHGAPSICRDNDGYLHVFYGAHDSTIKYARSTNPDDISAWTDHTTDSSPGWNSTVGTYPMPFTVPSTGKIYIFFRISSDGNYVYKTSTDGGDTWSSATNFITNGGSSDLAYLPDNSIWGETDGDDYVVHFVFHWRPGGPSHEWEDVYYVKFNTTDNHVYNVAGTDYGTTSLTRTSLINNFMVKDTTDDTWCYASCFGKKPSTGTPLVTFYWEYSDGNYKYSSLEYTGGTWTNQADIATSGANRGVSAIFQKGSTNVAIVDEGDADVKVYEYNWTTHAWSYSKTLLHANEVHSGCNWRNCIKQFTTDEIVMVQEVGTTPYAVALIAKDSNGDPYVLTSHSNVKPFGYKIRNFVSRTNRQLYNMAGVLVRIWRTLYNVREIVSSKNIQSYNIRNFVSYVNKQLYNVKNLVSKISGHLYNLKNFVSKMNPHLYNIENFVFKTNQQFYNIWNLIIKKTAHVYNISGILVRIWNTLYDVRNYVSGKNIQSYNIRALVSKINGQLYNVWNKIMKTYGYLYNLKNFASRTNRQLYHIWNRISRTTGNLYNLRNFISKINRQMYNVRNFVSRVNRQLYNMSGVLVKMWTVLYNIKKTISRENIQLYNVRAIISRINRQLYNLKNFVSKRLSGLYNIRNFVISARYFAYNLSSQLVKVFIAIYNIRYILTTKRGFLYNIRTSITRTNASLYNILGLISKKITALYDIRGFVVRTRIFIYNIGGAVIHVLNACYAIGNAIQKMLGTNYNIRNFTIRARSFVYNVRTSLSKEEGFIYNIRTGISTARGFIYNIRNGIIRSLISIYDLRNFVTFTRKFLYNIRLSISKKLTSLYTIRNFASRSFNTIYNMSGILVRVVKYIYNIRTSISKSRMFSYNIRSAVSRARTSVYRIFNFVVTARSSKYNIRGFVNSVGTTVYNIRKTTDNIVRGLYNIRGFVGSAKTFAYHVRSGISVGFHSLYNVLETAYSTRSFAYNISPTIIINRILRAIYVLFGVEGALSDPYNRLMNELYDYLLSLTVPGGEFDGFVVYKRKPKNKPLFFPCIIIDIDRGDSEAMFGNDYDEMGVVTIEIMFKRDYSVTLRW